MIRDPVLAKALRLTRRRKYDESIKILVAETFRYQDSYSYYHILGISCLYAGSFGDAFTYFNKARSIKHKEIPPLLGLAALFVRRGETDRALDLYLDVQESDPANKTAKRALNLLRRYAGTEELAAWVAQGKLSRLYPPLPRFGVPVKPLPLIIAGIAVATAAGIYLGVKALPVSQRGGMTESGLEKAELDNPVEMGGVYRYVLSADEVISLYNNARKLFNAHRDEAAKRDINRILESNASSPVKNKARVLKSYTETPGFDTLKDQFGYADVASDPLLYRDCHVLWRGSAANIRTGTGMVSFDFLVGYDTRTVMEGAVSVELEFPADINPAESLEVLGRVVPLAADTFKLVGVGIHQSPQS